MLTSTLQINFIFLLNCSMDFFNNFLNFIFKNAVIATWSFFIPVVVQENNYTFFLSQGILNNINFSGFFLLLLLTLIITSMFYVVFLKKFISSLTHMITAFVLISIFLFSLNLDFLAILTLLIYIGALLIFFLFAILLLLKFFSFKQLFSTNNILFYGLELIVAFLSFAVLSSSYFDLVYSSSWLPLYFSNPLFSLILLFFVYNIFNIFSLKSVLKLPPTHFEQWLDARIMWKDNFFIDQLENSILYSRTALAGNTHGLVRIPGECVDSFESLQISRNQFKSLLDFDFIKVYPADSFFSETVLISLNNTFFKSKKAYFFSDFLSENNAFLLNPYLYDEICLFSYLNPAELPIDWVIVSHFGEFGSINYNYEFFSLLLEETALLFNHNFSLNFLNSLTTTTLSKNLVEFNNIQLYGYTLYTKDGLAMILVSILLLSVVIISALKITTLVYSSNTKKEESA